MARCSSAELSCRARAFTRSGEDRESELAAVARQWQGYVSLQGFTGIIREDMDTDTQKANPQKSIPLAGIHCTPYKGR